LHRPWLGVGPAPSQGNPAAADPQHSPPPRYTHRMPRYAAFLRGVSPTNCTMPAVKAAFEAAGFTGVRTVLATGNVVFDAEAAPPAQLERRAEAALAMALKRPFPTIVRPIAALRRLLASDPYARARLDPRAKRVVTFLRARPKAPPALPVEKDGARVLRVDGAEALSAYVRSPKGPVFMVLIEKTFGKDVTTRTWETVEKVLRAAEEQ
jgi:uncharacterized protein (DUF1697 family)